MVQPAPWLRRVKRMVGIRERRPYTKALVLAVAHIVNRAVGYPGGVVPGHRQCRVPGFVRIRQGRQGLTVQSRSFFPSAIGVIPALIVLAQRGLHGWEHVVPLQHDFHMVKPHVRAVPVVAVLRAAFAALGGAGWAEGVRGCEVRLANQAGHIAVPRQGSGKTVLTGVVRQINSVVRDAMGTRQQAREHGRARGLADQIGRDAGRKTRAILRHLIQVGCLDFATLKPVAVTPLLVRGDE